MSLDAWFLTETHRASCSSCVESARYITEKQAQAKETILHQSHSCSVNSSTKEKRIWLDEFWTKDKAEMQSLYQALMKSEQLCVLPAGDART